MLITESFENLPKREKCSLNPGNYRKFLMFRSSLSHLEFFRVAQTALVAITGPLGLWLIKEILFLVCYFIQY